MLIRSTLLVISFVVVGVTFAQINSHAEVKAERKLASSEYSQALVARAQKILANIQDGLAKLDAKADQGLSDREVDAYNRMVGFQKEITQVLVEYREVRAREIKQAERGISDREIAANEKAYAELGSKLKAILDRAAKHGLE